MTIFDDIRRDVEAGTPGSWNSEAGNGPASSWAKASVGVWSEHKYDSALALDDDEFDPDDEKWVLGIWGKIGEEDLANARRIARVPELERIALAAEEAAKEALAVVRDWDGEAEDIYYLERAVRELLKLSEASS